MKKSLLALAVLGAFASAASAQTSVTIYGIVDVGVVHESGGAAGSVAKLTSGIGSGSRLGFRGTEDLGGGLSAGFVLETGLAVDGGGLSNNGAAAGAGSGGSGIGFGRQTFVSLNGGFGSVKMGRVYTPYFSTLTGIADPFGTGFAGNSTNVMSSSGVRMSNTIMYTTPAMGGFTGDLAYGFGEVAGDTSASRAVGAAAGYANGPIAVKLAHHNLRGTAAVGGSAKNTLLAGTYDFGVAKAHLGFGVNKTNTTAGGTTLDNNEWIIGATVPFGASKILASYIRRNDKLAANADANQIAIGYTYSLSKRTDLYASYARIDNKNTAAFTVGNASEAGTGDKAFNLGVRHSF